MVRAKILIHIGKGRVFERHGDGGFERHECDTVGGDLRDTVSRVE